MTADVTVLDVHQATNHSPTGDFSVLYVNADDGKTYTVYDNTPGYKLVVPQARLTLRYKENVKGGRTFNNCFGITPQPTTQKGTGEQMLETLKNIQETLQNILSHLPSKETPSPSNIHPDATQENGSLPF